MISSVFQISFVFTISSRDNIPVVYTVKCMLFNVRFTVYTVVLQVTNCIYLYIHFQGLF